MTVEVRYYCPHCERVATLERDPYMSDKSVTPYPLEGWTYVSPTEDYEADDVDGVRFVCGESDVDWHSPDSGVDGEEPDGEETDGEETDGEKNSRGERDSAGCGEPFYLNFVRYERGEEIERESESEYVTLASKDRPSGPRGPRGPGGPGR